MGPGPVIETERLILRPPTKLDLNNWASRIFANPDVIRYMPKRDMTPYQRAERALNVYNKLWAQTPVGGWVVFSKSEEQLIGSCEIDSLDETGEFELGYAFCKVSWGKGIATEAARAVVRFGFETAKLERIMAVVVPENIASWRVLEHLGFVYEKKANFYGFDDVAYYVIWRDQFKYYDSFYRVHNNKLSQV